MTHENNDLGELNRAYVGVPTTQFAKPVRAINPEQPDGQECGNCRHRWIGLCFVSFTEVFRPPKAHWCERWVKSTAP